MDHLKQIEVITDVLFRPITTASESDQPMFQDIEKVFVSRLQTVTDLLNSDTDLEWLTSAINGIMLNGPYEDKYWQFSEFGLKLLLCLYDELKLAREKCRDAVSEDASATDQMALPPDIISIQQQKGIQHILEFIICLGISRNLLPGIGIPLQRRSKFADIVLNNNYKPSDYNKHQMLFSTVYALTKCSSHPTLGSLIISRHLGDLLAALCQLCFAPLKKDLPEGLTEKQEDNYLKNLSKMLEDKDTSCKLLNTLVEKAFQPSVFREILLLHGPPSNKSQVNFDGGSDKSPLWLKKATKKLFSEGLMKKHGVEAGIQAILDSMGEDYISNEWAKYDIAAQLIVACPPKASEEKYFAHTCPQILDLFELKDELLCKEFWRAASSFIKIMTLNRPSLSQVYIIKPLTEPLLFCACYPETMHCRPTEKEFSVCITRLHQIFVSASDPDGKSLEILFPVMGILLHIATFLNSGVSFLRLLCEELICRYLKHVDVEIAKRTLREWLFTFDGKSEMLMWKSNLTLKNGSNGGIIIIDVDILNNDEYMWLEQDESKVYAVITLLSKLRDDRIVVQFFLSVLQDLPLVIQEHIPPRSDHHCSNASKELFNVETNQVQREHCTRKSIMIFQLLSALCEQSTLQESLMQDQMQIIHFIQVTLERGTHLCKNPGDHKRVQTETIAIAMAILSMIVSGKDMLDARRTLKCCLPPLEVLAAQHFDKEVRQLAKELCINISTHGAVNVSKNLDNKASHTNELTSSVEKQEKKIGVASVLENVEKLHFGEPNVLSKYQEACNDVNDPEPALKGHALLELGKLISSRDVETIRHKEKVLTIFLQNLGHSDSYVYLMAIRGLSSLADVFPDIVLPTLMGQYLQGGPTSSPELRMKLGEVLIKVTRILGEIIPKFREPLLHVFLTTTKDPDPFVRASSLSNLGEVCKELKYSLGSCIEQVFHCISSLIRTDTSASVRCAAISAITLIFQGIGVDSLKICEDQMKEIYRLLKLAVEVDKDDLVKYHAEIALGELGNICINVLFPQQTFEKKINILN